jgi:hypothetical protein
VPAVDAGFVRESTAVNNNSTVAPYNSAITRWNSECAESYMPGDMIRAENKNGFKLCAYTSAPCLTEEQRRKILEDESAAQ